MKKIIIIAVVVVVAAAAVYWLIIKKPSTAPPPGQEAGEQVTGGQVAAPAGASGVGGQLFEQVQQNPAEKLPETNPFGKDINPYKGAYTNPFE
jgi:hypothetical protein